MKPIKAVLSGKTNQYYRFSVYDNGVQLSLTRARAIMLAWVGDSKLQVNHINRDKLDDRLENLEWVTPRQNKNHAEQAKKNGKYSGVHMRADRKKYRAMITKNGRSCHIGYFEDEREAAKAYFDAYKRIEGFYPTHCKNPF